MGSARRSIPAVSVPWAIVARYTPRLMEAKEASVPEQRPLAILCVSTYEKGQEFIRTCKAIGCTVYLLTVGKLRDADWPREAIDEMFFMQEGLPLPQLLNAVSYAARTR